MPQVVDCNLFLYADDTCLLYQHKDLDQINKELTKIFVTYVTGLSITSWAFTLGTIKLNLSFSLPKNRKKKIGPLNYGNINIKKYSKVTYLGCKLDENLSGETMALKVINKINSRLRFLYRKNRYLSLYLKRLLCNAIINLISIMPVQLGIQTWTKNLKQIITKNTEQMY